MAQLADALLSDSFAVFGLSGGSPHVAAVVYKISERVTRAAIVSGVAPPEMVGRFSGMWPPVRLIFFLRVDFSLDEPNYPQADGFLLCEQGTNAEANETSPA